MEFLIDECPAFQLDSPESNYEIISEGPMEIGGETAEANLDEGYQGSCRITDFNNSIVAVLPSREVAYAVASYAITPDGGYGSVMVEPANGLPITHESLYDFI